MKKIYLLLFTMSIITVCNAQYTVNYAANGGNPGGLHNEDEFDGGVSWTSIHNATGIANFANIYSTPQTIPFTFEFNGSPVSQFKASNTGYITFDVAHPTPASALNVTTLPSASLPSNSVCAWGIYVDGQSGFAKMDMKVFGSAGSRQLWIAFRSFYNPNGTDAFDFTYWAIVLEEGSNKIYVVRQWEIDFGGTWQDFPVSVGVQINGSTAVEAPGNPISIAKVNTSNFSTDNDYWEFTPVPTGIKTNDSEPTLNIYPNPSEGIFNLVLPANFIANQVNVYSITGAEVYKSDKFQSTLDLSKLEKGVYFIKVRSNTNTLIKRLIIK